MTMNPLPPQAYTKETMLKAFQWLQAQPPSIREMALTPDILVSLYLKASRDGEQSLDRPSIQNFKNELKSLAGMMGELETPVTNGIGAATTTTTATTTKPVAPSMPPPVSTTHVAPIKTLDAKSFEMLREIKDDFNLSCENEALRMLIKIGFTKAKTILGS